MRAELTVLTLPEVTPVEAGYCPDWDFCKKMGGCMSGCSSGPGAAPDTDTAIILSAADERIKNGPMGRRIVDDAEMADAIDLDIGGAIQG